MRKTRLARASRFLTVALVFGLLAHSISALGNDGEEDAGAALVCYGEPTSQTLFDSPDNNQYEIQYYQEEYHEELEDLEEVTIEEIDAAQEGGFESIIPLNYTNPITVNTGAGLQQALLGNYDLINISGDILWLGFGEFTINRSVTIRGVPGSGQPGASGIPFIYVPSPHLNRIVLGNPAGGQGVLRLENIRLDRIGPGNAITDRDPIFYSSFANSHNWTVELLGNVLVGATGTLDEPLIYAHMNYSGFLIAENATVIVRGSNNQLNFAGRTIDGPLLAGSLGHMMHVRHVVVEDGAHLGLALRFGEGEPYMDVATLLRVGNTTNEGSIQIGNNGQLVVFSGLGGRRALDGNFSPELSHSIYGYISRVNVEAGGRLQLISNNVAFRSVTSTRIEVNQGAINATGIGGGIILAASYDETHNRNANLTHEIIINNGRIRGESLGSHQQNHGILVVGNESVITATGEVPMPNPVGLASFSLNAISRGGTALRLFGESTRVNILDEANMSLSAPHGGIGLHVTGAGAQVNIVNSHFPPGLGNYIPRRNIIASTGSYALKIEGGNNRVSVRDVSYLFIQGTGAHTVAISFDGIPSTGTYTLEVLGNSNLQLRSSHNRVLAGTSQAVGTIVEVSSGSTVGWQGNLPSGVITGRNLRMDLRAGSNFDLRNGLNNGLGRGPVFANTAEGAATATHLIGHRTDLSVWCSSLDFIGENPTYSWVEIFFHLRDSNMAEFVGDMADERLREVFTGGGAQRFARWNNAPILPRIAEVRIPTDADQHVYGRVKVGRNENDWFYWGPGPNDRYPLPGSGDNTQRWALPGEVFVNVEIRNPQTGSVLLPGDPTGANFPVGWGTTNNLVEFDPDAAPGSGRDGVFRIYVGDIIRNAVPGSEGFIPEHYEVQVVAVRRTTSGEAGFNAGRFHNIDPYVHVCGANCPADCISDINIESYRARSRDVTPPLPFGTGNAPVITEESTVISAPAGSGVEPGTRIQLRFGAEGNDDRHSWSWTWPLVGGDTFYTTADDNGAWSIDLPDNLVAYTQIAIYASDNQGLADFADLPAGHIPVGTTGGSYLRGSSLSGNLSPTPPMPNVSSPFAFNDAVFPYRPEIVVGARDVLLLFEFHKTDDRIYSQQYWNDPGWIEDTLLPGAHFNLVRYNGPGTPAAVVVTQGMMGSGDNQWTLVNDIPRISSGNHNDPIDFILTPGNYYQLIEVVAPEGFQLPFGQWRIVGMENAAGEAGFRITAVGDSTVPAFVNIGGTHDASYDAHFGGTFYVGNRRNFDVPTLGGVGSRIFLILGTGMLLIAVGMTLHKMRKARKV